MGLGSSFVRNLALAECSEHTFGRLEARVRRARVTGVDKLKEVGRRSEAAGEAWLGDRVQGVEQYDIGMEQKFKDVKPERPDRILPALRIDPDIPSTRLHAPSLTGSIRSIPPHVRLGHLLALRKTPSSTPLLKELTAVICN
jgi:hypothetical protein